MTKKEIISSYSLAILLHLFIILSFTLELFKFQPEVIQPISHIKAYISYEQIPTIQQQPLKAIQTQALPINSNSTQAKIKTKKNIKTKPVNNSKSDTTNPSTINSNPVNTNINYAPLVAQLHDLIQQHQQYPRSTLFLRKSGAVRIGFTLFPDGHLENLIIVTSSGSSDLDNAALSAVAAISPVKIAKLYLNQAKIFYINIAFVSQ